MLSTLEEVVTTKILYLLMPCRHSGDEFCKTHDVNAACACAAWAVGQISSSRSATPEAWHPFVYVAEGSRRHSPRGSAVHPAKCCVRPVRRQLHLGWHESGLALKVEVSSLVQIQRGLWTHALI